MPQRVLDVLYKHMSSVPSPLSVSCPSSLDLTRDPIAGDQQTRSYAGAATLVFDLQRDLLVPTVSPQRLPIAEDDIGQRIAQPLVPAELVQPSRGRATVSDVLERPDEGAAACVSVMCDFDQGPAPVRALTPCTSDDGTDAPKLVESAGHMRALRVSAVR